MVIIPPCSGSSCALGIMAPDVAPAEIETKLGLRIAKVEIDSQDVLGGLFHFILLHRPDVLVLATHGRHIGQPQLQLFA